MRTTSLFLRIVLPATLALATTGALAGARHHELAVTLDPTRQELSASDRVTLDAGTALEFDLADRFSVERVTVNGKPAATRSERRPDGTRRWQVEAGAAPQGAVVEVQWRGRLAPLDRSLDHRDVLKPMPPFAAVPGSFLPAGAAWFPQFGDGLFTYRVRIDVPDGQRALVPGRLLGERIEANRYRAEFDFPHPAEGIDLMAGPYEIAERTIELDGVRSVRLRTYFHETVAALAGDYLDSVERYLILYDEWIGAYPFTEFSVVTSPLSTGFGMPTLTYLGVDVVKLPFIRATSLGHEVLHNWWGNGVYPDWRRGNWSEGLTTFMADYFYKEQAGAPQARDMRLEWLRDFAAMPPGEDRPVASFVSRTHGASQIVGYNKVAFLFYMLREEIGRDAFDAGIRLFWERNRFKVAGWREIQAAFETASSQDLAGFFRQWVGRAGAPEFRLQEARGTPANGGTRVEVSIGQGEPPWQVALPLAFERPGGSERRVVKVAGARADAAVAVAGQPRTVALDPDFQVFRRLEAGEYPPILRQVMVDPASVAVMVSADAAFREAASGLAGRLLDHRPKPADGWKPGDGPALVLGTPSEIDARLAAWKLPPRPKEVVVRGTAQVWTERLPEGGAAVLVSARDAAALTALVRPLPHYGRQSWLVFDGSQALERGVWPTGGVRRAIEGTR